MRSESLGTTSFLKCRLPSLAGTASEEKAEAQLLLLLNLGILSLSIKVCQGKAKQGSIPKTLNQGFNYDFLLLILNTIFKILKKRGKEYLFTQLYLPSPIFKSFSSYIEPGSSLR